MKACYIDESGCPNVLQQTGNPDITPLFVVTAVFFDLDDLPEITGEFTFLKQKHFWPNKSWHDCMHTVYKGSEIRRAARSDYLPDQQRNFRFLRRVMRLLHKKEAKIVSMAYIKGVGKTFNGVAVYTSAVQAILSFFQRYLEETNDKGIAIADSREKSQNEKVSHSVFTKKFSAQRAYSNLVEMPLFSHSDNHVGLQLADIICSGLVFPIASYSYCRALAGDTPHVSNRFYHLKKRFIRDIKDLEYRFETSRGYNGGIVVSNFLDDKGPLHFFD